MYLGNIEKQWRMFTRQMDKTQQLLNSLLQKPLAPTQLFSTLQAELNSLDSIHMSYKPTYSGSHSTFEEGTFI